MESFLQHFGYLAIFIVSCVTGGTTILPMAGFAAHQGHLTLLLVIAFGSIGGFLNGLAWYLVARRRGRSLLASRPRWAERAHRFETLVARHPLRLLLITRFLPGVRSLGSVAAGLAGLSPPAYSGFSAVATLICAIALTAAGYALGHTLELLVGDLRKFEVPVLAALAVVGAALWLRQRRHGHSE